MSQVCLTSPLTKHFALSMKLVRTLVQGRGTLSARDFSSVVSGFCQANHKYKMTMFFSYWPFCLFD